MKTDDLISMLATGAGPAPRAVVARRLAPAAMLGLSAAAVLALAVVGPVPAEFYALAAPWFKLGYAAALAAVAAWAVGRLARPLPRWREPAWALAGVVVVALGLSLAAPMPPADGAGWLGHSWAECPWNVLGLSLPGLAAGLWAVRGLAPTRLRLAGAAVGLLAGACAAAGYALCCDESALRFVAVWYTAGIALSAGLGALLGPRVLRW